MLKTRDIPDQSRPVAYRCYTESLGKSKMGIRVMIGLGELFAEGKDMFWITKYYHFYVRILKALQTSKDDAVKRTVSKYYKEKIIAKTSGSLTPFVERNFLSLLSATHRNFLNGLPIVPNDVQNAQERDARKDDSSNAEGNIK